MTQDMRMPPTTKHRETTAKPGVHWHHSLQHKAKREEERVAMIWWRIKRMRVGNPNKSADHDMGQVPSSTSVLHSTHGSTLLDNAMFHLSL